MIIRGCLIAAALVLLPTFSTAEPAAAGPRRLLGILPTDSCQTWLQERQQNEAWRRDTAKKAKSSAAGLFLEYWVWGFISSASLPQDGRPSPLDDPSANVDEDDVLMRMDIYCRGHSYETLGAAAMTVVVELLQDQRDRLLALLRYCQTAPNEPRCQQERQASEALCQRDRQEAARLAASVASCASAIPPATSGGQSQKASR
jgi:hypothetical protein